MMRDELRQKYPIGRRVVATAKYREAFDTWRNEPDGPTGVVLGYGRPGRLHPDEPLVRVLRDGTKQAVTYHADFWEPIV